jgi:hypothetical protein
MNDLYDEIETFFKNGGTLKQLFEVLKYYFELEGSDEE